MIKRGIDRILTQITGRRPSPTSSTSAAAPARAADQFPVPPADVRYRIASREYSEDEFLTHGKSLCEGFLQELRTYGVQPKRILDLGCGCGRIIRHFIARGGIECYGSDTDAVGVQWCQRNLPGGTFTVNERLPPMPYRDQMFDFIYAHSVFTHIDLESQYAWLREFRRLTVPGGLVRITTMGEGGFRGRSDVMPQHVKDEFLAKGFVFFDNFTDGVLPNNQ